MAVKPYIEGKVWSFRLRIKGQSLYRTGFPTEVAARREAERLRQKILEAGQPKNAGPWQSTVAEALQQYALERLPFLKGARQEANRINRYLRAAKLATLVIATLADPSEEKRRYWTVSLAQEVTDQRAVPNSLLVHRRALEDKSQATARVVRLIAKESFASLMTYQMQELVDAMQADGYEAASIGLERALLRQLYNYARKAWHWVEPGRNPATHLVMPKIDNARDRVLSNGEWSKICKHLGASKNPYVAPGIALLLETAMRVSEPILHATWGDVDWQGNLLHLKTAKAGARSVPMSPAAMDVLRLLHSLNADTERHDRILPVSYEALKAAWKRACRAAGVEDVRIHDLRHTAATRYTLELNGNLPLLKVITGHKTYSQLSRYINVKPEDVSRLLHGRPLTEAEAPAGLHLKRAELLPPSMVPSWDASSLPENVVPLRRG